jgi:hypothetical protein
MALRYSTGAKLARAGMQAVVHALMRTTGTIAFVDGGAGADTITDSGNGFVTAGFRPGDVIRILTSTGTNDKPNGVVPTAVAAGTITLPTATITAEAAGTNIVALAAAKGGSVKDLFDFGTIHIYTSPQPASADDAETGTLLAKITAEGVAFTGGAIANGLRFADDPAANKISKLSTQNWKTLANLASGNAVWGRIYDNAYTLGYSESAVRADFTIGTSGADLIGQYTSLIIGKPCSIDDFSIECR